MKKTTNHLIVIPAYNEELTIESVVLGAKSYGDVCVIDDCSQDRTPEILDQISDIHVIRHEQNTHIAGALLDAMAYAVDNDYAYIITMDAGLSHNPDELVKFINYPPCDLVIGTRVLKTNTPLYRRLLSIMGNYVYNRCLDSPKSLFSFSYYRDITSGYRRYSNKAIKLILACDIKSRTISILFETTSIIYRNRLTISEVPITYWYSNSSLNVKAILDCVTVSLLYMLKIGIRNK